jgi:murein DD-endopeptidase MepM/ murein hydrolase activator NlpD
MPFANVAGNFVTVRMAGGRYATYAHLQLGSVRVRVHQRVAPGQVLGLLGNSGQATGPHLHFQVTDGPSVLGAEGVPFRLTAFRHVGFGATYEPGATHEDVLRRGEMPVDDEIVRLP